ncbi:unnamed protein product [Rotaria sp. Silwood1]|nr:unnamed protein product [Rotaria sp. Silwood1]
MNSTPLLKKRYHIGKSVKNMLMGFFTEYETPKLVLIHSAKYAGILRIIQIIILIYSVIYLLIYEKGYQKQDTAVISSVTLKVKGIGYAHTLENKTLIIDVADYIIPPSENNAIFIMSNFVQTDQTRTICAEHIKVEGAKCQNDTQCSSKPFTPDMNGRWTGRCLLSPEKDIGNETTNITKTRTGLCEYAGWCPPEDDLTSTMLIQGVLDFTLFIKNFIEFPMFEVKHKNMVDSLKKSCTYHPKDHKDCPIFTIDYIMSEAEKNITERNLMLRYGGVVRIKLDWDCNLDRNIKLCKPEYSFARLDVPFYEKPFSKGFNFRHATAWKHNEDHFRALTKAFGLRFIISVSGKAGKFDIITSTLNIGSLVGLFGLATFVCDILLLHLSKKSDAYRNYVFEIVHLRTRFNSAIRDARIHFQSRDEIYPNSVSNDKTALSNGAIGHLVKSPGTTVSIRPLILIHPDK